MPARDLYHYQVISGLEKDGWAIEQDPATIFLPGRRLYIDIFAKRGNSESALIEIKVFEEVGSQNTYLANAVGQYLLYKAALEYVRDSTPLYLAVPDFAHKNFLSEKFAHYFIEYSKVKLMVFNPTDEEITQWIP